MVSLYRATDCLVNVASANPTDGWDPAEPCVVDPAARADLLCWRDTLAAGASCRDPFPSDLIRPFERSYRRVPFFPSFWPKTMVPCLPTDPQLPMDGSLQRWGASANLRELFMFPWTTEEIGARRLTGNSILFRHDISLLVGAVNKGASPHPESLALLLWLLKLLERYDIGRYDIELIARHIPGGENALADCLSRLSGTIDDQ
eukprot:jgi/Tetstr1/457855/TSEL_004257.t1